MKHSSKNTYSKEETLIFGIHACKSAILNSLRKKIKIFIAEEKVTEYQELIGEPLNHCTLEIVKRKFFDTLLPKGAVHQCIAVVAKDNIHFSIEDIVKNTINKKNSMLLMIDQIQDPHNIGAIVRSAAAFGADGVIIPKDHSPMQSSIIAKSASGGVEKVPIISVTNLARTIDLFKKNNFWIYALDGKSSNTLFKNELHEKSLIIIGSEHNGIRKLLQEKSDFLISIPMTKNMESLNASNAAAIAMYSYFIKHNFSQK